MISPRLSLTAFQSSSTVLKISPDNGPSLIMSTTSRTCETLLAPSMIPSSSFNTEWYTIQRIATWIGVKLWNFVSASNFFMAECKSSAPKRARANLPRGLSSPKRVPACSLLTSFPVKKPEARGLVWRTVSRSLTFQFDAKEQGRQAITSLLT